MTMEAISACCIKMYLNRRPDDEAPKQQAARGDAFERNSKRNGKRGFQIFCKTRPPRVITRVCRKGSPSKANVVVATGATPAPAASPADEAQALLSAATAAAAAVDNALAFSC